MGLLDAFKQYVRDALPGGLLNAEIEQGANDTANAIRAKGKAFERGLLDPQQYAGEALRAGMDMAGMAPLGLTVWHGSPHKFSKFDMSKIGTTTDGGDFGSGFYFTPNKEVARKYGENLIEAELNMRNPLTIKNGFSDIVSKEFWSAYNARDYHGMSKALKRMGYDGVIDTSGDYAQHVVFDPSQINIISK